LVGGVVGQPFDQGFYPGAGGTQPGAQGVAVLSQQADLLGKQLIASLQLVVAQQQALHAVSDFGNFKPDFLLNTKATR
jgi:hypothetical protein